MLMQRQPNHMIPRPGIQKPPSSTGSYLHPSASGHSDPRSGTWQSQGGSSSHHGRQASGHDSMAMIIPRAKVKHTNSSSHSRTPRGGYHSDDDFFTQDEVSFKDYSFGNQNGNQLQHLAYFTVTKTRVKNKCGTFKNVENTFLDLALC